MRVSEGLLAFAKIALIFVIGFPLLMYLAQDSLIFHPQPLEDSKRAALQGPAVESLFIHGADGTRLHAWHVKGDPLVIYFGGNAEEVSWMIDAVRSRAPGVGWLLVDYRGYGSSGGSPSEKALVSDALRWYDHFKSTQKIYLFGRSLGSGVAVQLAAERPVAGLVLVAPFDSLVAVGQRHYPILPVGWMLRHRFDSLALAPKMKAPLLCIVASHDEIVPPEHAKRLYDAWGGPRRWVGLQGAGHNSTDAAANYWPSIQRFLTEKPL
jgi:pimeloyl-ACP methyl ester carboxylesterase